MAVTALHEHRKRMLAEGHAAVEFVFCGSRGDFLRSYTVRKEKFYPLLKRAGLRQIRFHDLRHTSSTLLFMDGENPKVVSERLGHSKIATTLEIYGHVLPSMQRAAASKFDQLLGKTGT